MNGNSRYEAETLDSLVGELAYYESDETDESEPEFFGRRGGRGGGRRPPPRTAPGSGMFQPRPQTSAAGGANYVTQPQLQTALARVGEQIKTNSEAIKTLSARANTLAAEQERQAAVLKRETERSRRDLRRVSEMSALLPLISKPKSQTITIPSVPADVNAGIPAVPAKEVKVLVDSDDSLSTLLPFMMMGGIGGSGGSGGGLMGGGEDNSMMFLVLALAMGKK